MISTFVLRSVLACAGIGIDGKADHDLVVKDPHFVWPTLLGGRSITFGEAYMRGEWACRRLDLFFEQLIRSGLVDKLPGLSEWKRRLALPFLNRQDKVRSRRVAEVHYNLDAAFYELLLGKSLNYTSAVYMPGADTLDAAQEYKMRLIGRKIPGLRAGQHVLDIGCGWGGLMHVLARDFGVRCTGITISQTQLEYAQAKYAGSNFPLDFRLCDYRDFGEPVDHITSVCMSEHVGVRNLPTYFAKARQLVSLQGYMVWQGILVAKAKDRMEGFLDKYIFPGGEIPETGEVRAAATRSWQLLDEHYFGESYYKTLMAWHDNLVARRKEVLERFGEEFFRMFEFYLLMCAGAFKAGHLNVAQFVLAASPQPGYVPVR